MELGRPLQPGWGKQPLKRPLRIVHCFRSPVGGIFRHVRDLAEAQAADGHLVGLVCDSSTGGAHEERLFAESAGRFALGIRRTPMQRHIGPGDIMSAWRTFKHIKELQPDVLHGHGAKGGVYARLFGSLLRASRSRVARLYSPHGGSLHYDEDTLVGKVFFLLERIMARATDHLLFVSDYERQTYFRKVGRPRAATSLVYNGLLPAEFEPVPPAAGAADFLYIGMMRDLKGPDVFLKALAQLAASGRKATAHFVGDGPDKPRYQAMIADLGLGESVTVHDAMPARKAFALAETVVVPSRAESMPYIVLEAIAAQKPVICTDVGGIPEIFAEEAGRLVEPGSVEALGKAMSATLDDGNRQELAGKMHDALRARFSVEVMARDVMEAYRACR